MRPPLPPPSLEKNCGRQWFGWFLMQVRSSTNFLDWLFQRSKKHRSHGRPQEFFRGGAGGVVAQWINFFIMFSDWSHSRLQRDEGGVERVLKVVCRTGKSRHGSGRQTIFRGIQEVKKTKNRDSGILSLKCLSEIYFSFARNLTKKSSNFFAKQYYCASKVIFIPKLTRSEWKMALKDKRNISIKKSHALV